MATRLRAGGSKVRIQAGTRDISLLRSVQPGFGAHPASYLIGIRVLSPQVKRPGSIEVHLPPSSTEVKNECSYASIPPLCLLGVEVDKLTFLKTQTSLPPLQDKIYSEKEERKNNFCRKVQNLVHDNIIWLYTCYADKCTQYYNS
jgi:hypothetical protein